MATTSARWTTPAAWAISSTRSTLRSDRSRTASPDCARVSINCMEASDHGKDPRPLNVAEQIAELIEEIEEHLGERTDALSEEEE